MLRIFLLDCRYGKLLLMLTNQLYLFKIRKTTVYYSFSETIISKSLFNKF